MIDDELARVRWQTGEILRPDHFRLLERSLAAESALRVAALGLPSYGVAELTWPDDELAAGQLAVRDLVVVFPSGRVVATANSKPLAPLDLAAAQRAKVDVLLYVREPDPEAEAAAEVAPRPPGLIPRTRLELKLSTDEAEQGYPERLRLARFETSIGGKWRLSNDFVPPLLCVRKSPFFADRLATLRASLTGFDNALRAQLRDPLLRGEAFAKVQHARIAGMRLQALFDDLDAGITLHPYTLYAALRSLWLDLCAYAGAPPDEPAPGYAHDKLASVLPPLFDRLAAFLEPPAGAGDRAVVAFTRTADGRLLAGALGDETLHAPALYLLVQRPRGATAVSLERVRLASAKRLRPVLAQRLRGVPLERVDVPALGRRFGPGMDFYRLVITDEWRHVLEERTLAFQALPELDGIEAALYWSDA